jgi:hypothetical protein
MDVVASTPGGWGVRAAHGAERGIGAVRGVAIVSGVPTAKER